MRSFNVKEKYIGKSISYCIGKEFPRLSSSSLNKVFRVKDVKVNGNRVSKDYIVNFGDNVQVYLNDNILFGYPSDIFYAYEDDNILVAYKPKGITSNLEGKPDDTQTVYFDDLVKAQKGNEIKICHRLDTNTEGLVIFSKNTTSYDALLTAFKNKQIHKEYLALVYGKLPKQHDILSEYITMDKRAGFSKVQENKDNNAKECITEYTVNEYIQSKNCSVISVKLHTGRTHQIRAHMKHIGNPVIGDPKYCTNEINDKFRLYSQVLYASNYSFTFSESSPLYYLNDINITIDDMVKNKIHDLLHI